MRRIALLGISCLLAGCQFAGNPLDGAGGFLYDTQLWHSNPNLPAGADETMQRVQGKDVAVEPLTPEEGDIWPGAMLAVPDMQNLDQSGGQPLPAPNVPSAPPPLLFPETPMGPQGGPQGSAAPPAAPAPIPASAQKPQQPQKPQSGGGAAGGGSDDGQPVIVPNGDGTSTVIRPDGSIQTIPTPK